MHLLRVWVAGAGVNVGELSAPEPTLDWAGYDSKGAFVAAGSNTLAELPPSVRTDLILPFERVLLTTVTLPKQNRRQLQRVVPYALEDRLLTAPEHSHCALGVTSGNVWPVAVVDRPWLQQVLATVRSQRTVHAVWPGWYWLPVGARLWLGAEGWSRSHIHQGDYLSEMPRTDDAEPLLDADDYSWESLDWARRQPDAQAINLLQGSFSTQPSAHGSKSPWRLTTVLALAVLLISYGQLGWSVHQKSKEAKALTARINDSFYKVFPASATIVDPVLQVERKLKESSSGAGAASADDFLVMLNTAAGFVRPQGPAAGIDYAAGELQLRVRLQASDASAMPAAAQAAGMRIESQAPTKPDDPTLIKLRRAGEPS